ncbi:MAG: peptidoglycan recognition family protein [Phycisphaeraceae bacterium]
MNMSRRQMLLAGLGLLVGGCSTRDGNRPPRPRTHWPGAASRPRSGAGTDVAAPAPPHPTRTSAPVDAALDVLPRSRWASTATRGGRVNPMNGINRITLHHEGWTTVDFTDLATTQQRLERIRSNHVNNLGWADIGYHYVIDRAGRLWEGRPIGYQGAHVGGNNEHNLGIMLLGNFDNQQPTRAQLDAMVDTVRTLRRRYNVPAHRVVTHQEITPTACPGRRLQPQIVRLRSAGRFA